MIKAEKAKLAESLCCSFSDGVIVLLPLPRIGKEAFTVNPSLPPFLSDYSLLSRPGKIRLECGQGGSDPRRSEKLGNKRQIKEKGAKKRNRDIIHS